MDNESRYVNSRLREFCELEDIDLQNPIAFSPQKKNVVAMRIRTLKSMASCMIQAKSLDPSLEFEAISSANHILNKSPHNILDGKSPFEALCCRQPIVKHFIVFGCPTWANITSQKWKTPPPKPCTFIRYEDNVKSYRLMDPETHEIFIERNVHFEKILPSLSSNPLHTSYIVETDSDNSDNDSIDSNMWDPIERYRMIHNISTFHMHTFL